MSRLSILVIEDDPLARELMSGALAGHGVDFAHDFASGRRKLEASRPDLCFIDLSLGKGDVASGLKLVPLAAARGAYPVVMSMKDSDFYVEKAYAGGARDFYSKGELSENVAAALARYRRRTSKDDPSALFESDFVTKDAATRAAVSRALTYAGTDLPILILGPSGTGKTKLASIIHDRSGRRGPFVAVNCASYAEDLLESELLGYHRGAFTGASTNHRGKLLLADQGTIFLDEIGAMSVRMQTKLLKAIEERCFYPLGSEKPVTSSFRVMSATLESVPDLIKSGRLRLDFFQRIHGLTVELRPLSQRPGDIPALIASMTKGGRKVSFTAEAKELLARREWTGNVRELKHLVDLLAAGEEGAVTAEALTGLLATLASHSQPGGGFATEEQYRHALEHGLAATLARLEESIIKRHLAANGDAAARGAKARVMKDLRISTRALYKTLRHGGPPADRGS